MASIADFRTWLNELARFGKIDQHTIITASPTRLKVQFFTDNNTYSISVHERQQVKVRAPSAAIERKKLTVTELEALINDGSQFIELGPDGYALISPAAYVLDQGYLGCIASSRKPRAGEEHVRGRDLVDGPLSPETWHSILADIVSYEMVRVHAQPPSAATPATPDNADQ